MIPWDEVTLDQGTGIVHIAPGCGAEDFDLSRQYGLAVLPHVQGQNARRVDRAVQVHLHGQAGAQAAQEAKPEPARTIIQI